MKFFKFSLAVGVAAGLYGSASAEQISLEQAIKEVCTNSDSAKMMRQSIKKSDAQVREGWSNAFPTISASAAAAKSHGSLTSSMGGGSSSSSNSTMGSAGQIAPAKGSTPVAAGTPTGTPDPDSPVTWGALESMFSSFSEAQTSTVYTSSLNISQPIFTFGKIGTAIKVAKNFNKATSASYSRNLQTLQLATLDAFWATVLAAKSGAIAKHSVARKQELSDFQERNFRLGAGSKAQILAIKADLARQNASVITSERDAYTARMALNMLMGRDLGDLSALDTTTLPNSLHIEILPSPEEATKIALARRSDLKSLQFLAEATQGGAKIYRATYLPSIGATGSLGWSKYTGSPVFSTPDNGLASWTVGIGASWTFFDGMAHSAKAAQYQADAEKLAIAGSAVSKSIEIEIRSNIAECAAADTNLAASQEAFNAAQEGYSLTSNDFKQGKGQFADLQLADEQLLQAELGLINARYRQLRSRAALLVAMGQDIVPVKKDK